MPSLTTLSDIPPRLQHDAGLVALLRSRLMLLVLVAALPLLTFVLVDTAVTHHARLDWLESELRDAARQAAAREADELGRAARLLDAMATAPMAADALCAALRPRLAGGPGAVVALSAHFADARPACAVALQDGRVIDSQHVRTALAAEGAVTLSADPGAGLVLARRLIVSGGADAVLALALSPVHLPPLSLPLRRDQARRLLVDPADGMVLATQSDEAARESRDTLNAPRVLAALRAGITDGVVVARDATGTRRLTGYAELALPAAISGRAALLIELPYDELLAEADARRLDQWLAAFAMVLMGAVVAAVLSNRSLVEPVRRSLSPLPGSPQARDQALATLRPAGAWLRQQGDLAAVTEAAGEMFLRLDAAFRVLYASPATRRILGYAPSEVVDADLAAEPGWAPCQAQLEALRRGAEAARPIRILARRRDDAEVRLEVRASKLGDGGFMLACRDVGAEHGLETRLSEALARLTTLGLTDAQSGLANARRFDDALDEEVRRGRRAQEPVSLVLVRLADWRSYATRQGSAGAEAAVLRVARILSASLRRPGDLAARLEGDVFAVLLPTSDRIGVQRIAERLQESLSAEWRDAPDAAVTALIGACCVLPLAETDGPQTLLDLAHQALREAAQPGRGLALVVPPIAAAPPVLAAQRESLAF